jgi:hypothetical protein
LSYAGRELPPSLDSSLLELKPGIDTVAALQRANAQLGMGEEREAEAAAATAAEKAAVAAAVAPAAPRRTRRRQQEREKVSKLAWATASDEVSPDRRRQAVRQVPGSRQGCSAELQLARQFRDLLRNPIPGVSAAPSEDDLFT